MNNKDNDSISLISREINGFCLSYVNGEYILFFKDNKSKFPNMRNPQELYDNILNSNHYDELDNQNKLISYKIADKLDIKPSESNGILCGLMKDLHTIFFNTPKEKQPAIVNEILQKIDNPKIKERFQQQIIDFKKSKYLTYEESVKQKLQTRKSGDVETARRDLSNYLKEKYGAILRKNIGDIYLQDGDGYIPIDHDSLILRLRDDFGDNFIHDDDLKKAMGYLSERIDPEHNIVKFKNGLYDMDKLEPYQLMNQYLLYCRLIMI